MGGGTAAGVGGLAILWTIAVMAFWLFVVMTILSRLKQIERQGKDQVDQNDRIIELLKDIRQQLHNNANNGGN